MFIQSRKPSRNERGNADFQAPAATSDFTAVRVFTSPGLRTMFGCLELEQPAGPTHQGGRRRLQLNWSRANFAMMKRTPLFEAHQRLGGKLIEFGGWEMPVQYTSIVDEHLAVRNAAGLFDISHMGEILFEGPHAEAFLNQTLTNNIRKLAVGQGQYTLMCNEG